MTLDMYSLIFSYLQGSSIMNKLADTDQDSVHTQGQILNVLTLVYNNFSGVILYL